MFSNLKLSTQEQLKPYNHNIRYTHNHVLQLHLCEIAPNLTCAVRHFPLRIFILPKMKDFYFPFLGHHSCPSDSLVLSLLAVNKLLQVTITSGGSFGLSSEGGSQFGGVTSLIQNPQHLRVHPFSMSAAVCFHS